MSVYLTRNFQFPLISVIRAKVLSQKVNNDSRVFDLEILQTFKGASEVNQTEGIHVNGSGQGSLFAKAYTHRDSATCGVSLTNGTVYLLGGLIRNGTLKLYLCDLNEKWSQVTPNQRDGFSRFYGQNCECQVSRACTWDGWGELKGCADDSVQSRDNSYCVKNDDETACSWNCTSKATNMTFYLVVLLYLLIFV